jgi:hypothetical protein
MICLASAMRAPQFSGRSHATASYFMAYFHARLVLNFLTYPIFISDGSQVQMRRIYIATIAAFLQRLDILWYLAISQDPGYIVRRMVLDSISVTLGNCGYATAMRQLCACPLPAAAVYSLTLWPLLAYLVPKSSF